MKRIILITILLMSAKWCYSQDPFGRGNNGTIDTSRFLNSSKLDTNRIVFKDKSNNTTGDTILIIKNNGYIKSLGALRIWMPSDGYMLVGNDRTGINFYGTSFPEQMQIAIANLTTMTITSTLITSALKHLFNDDVTFANGVNFNSVHEITETMDIPAGFYTCLVSTGSNNDTLNFVSAGITNGNTHVVIKADAGSGLIVVKDQNGGLISGATTKEWNTQWVSYTFTFYNGGWYIQ